MNSISKDFDICDVQAIRDYCLHYMATNNAQFCNVYIHGEIKVKELLNAAIIPWRYDEYFLLLPYINYPDDFVSYWYNLKPNETLSSWRIWSMISEDLAKQENEPSLLKYTYPNLLYSSNRIKTDMSMFRTSFSHTGTWSKNFLVSDTGIQYNVVTPEKKRTYTLKGEYCIPVTRYAASIDVGLYHDTPGNFCGTFYYYEPQSTTFLTATKVLVCETKCSGAEFLYNRNSNPQLRSLIDGYLQSEENKNWEQKFYRDDFRYTPIEALELGVTGRGDPYSIPQRKFYIGNLIMDDEGYTLYGAEDLFDQAICVNGFELGYELIVLTRMVGGYQIVTEVLDTRDRERSWASLVYTQIQQIEISRYIDGAVLSARPKGVDCTALAAEINRRTGLPVYGLYIARLMDEPEHYVIQIKKGVYLDCNGVSTEDELLDFWFAYYRSKGYYYDKLTLAPLENFTEEVQDKETIELAEYLIHKYL